MEKRIYGIGMRKIDSVEQFFHDTTFNDYDDNCPKELLTQVKELLLEIYSDYSLPITSDIVKKCAEDMRNRLKQFRESGELINFKVSENISPETKMIDIYLQPRCTIETICFTATLF